MASENIGSLFPTKIPGYSEAADIQAALRLYHYGSGTVEDSLNTNPAAINPQSIAGYLKSIEDDIEAINDIGIGSDFVATQPTDVPDGFIWVDADSSPVSFAGRQWSLHDSGNLSGTELEIADLDGESHYIFIRNADSSEPTKIEIDVNENSFVLALDPSGASKLLPTRLIYKIELANTNAAIKPFYPYSSDNLGVEDPEQISSVNIKLKHFLEGETELPELILPPALAEFQFVENLSDIEDPEVNQVVYKLTPNPVFYRYRETVLSATPARWSSPSSNTFANPFPFSTIAIPGSPFGVTREDILGLSQTLLNGSGFNDLVFTPSISYDVRYTPENINTIIFETEEERDVALLNPQPRDRAMVLNSEYFPDQAVLYRWYPAEEERVLSAAWTSIPSPVAPTPSPTPSADLVYTSLDAPEFTAGTYEVWSYR